MIRLLRENTVKLNPKEILRYLGYNEKCNADTVTMLIEDAVSEFEKSAEYKACFDVFPVSLSKDGAIDFGFARILSHSLSKNLKGCRNVVLFTATIGAMADRLIMRYSSVCPSRAVVLQAIGAAAIEGWCDTLTEQLSELDFMNGKLFRPRFSPGYGDLPLTFQKDINSVLDAPRQIGVTLTDSLMMSPTKSVSAIIGIID